MMREKAAFGSRHHCRSRLRYMPRVALPGPKRALVHIAGHLPATIPKRKALYFFDAGNTDGNTNHHRAAPFSSGQDRFETTFIVSPAAFVFPSLRLYLLNARSGFQGQLCFNPVLNPHYVFPWTKRLSNDFFS